MATKLVVIVGETATGKSALGIKLAKRFSGEIICADSRTIYKGLDIGAAKPTKAEQAEVRHHLLDVVESDEHFTAADFKRLALAAIEDITSRGKLPIMVGGSGLYIDSVLFDYRFGPAPDPTRRAALGNMSLIELQKHAQELGLTVKDINFHNKRHLARAIENNGVIKQEHRLRPNTLVIGLLLDRQRLYRRIHKRIENMIQTGFIDEVKQLAETYGWGSEAMTGIGYKAFRKYLEGDMTLKQAQEEFQKGDRQLAKKQRTWFRRNKYIQWLADPIQAVAIVTTFLNK